MNSGGSFVRRIKWVTAGTVAASLVVASQYRPRGSFDKEYWAQPHKEPSVFEEKLISIARTVVLVPTITLSKAFLAVLQKPEWFDYDKFYDTLHKGDRPVMTVSNHTSVLDDPVIMSAMIPLKGVIAHRYVRWGVCSEELCFFNAPVGTWIGTGKTFPIARGAGLKQQALAELSTVLKPGEWVHLFAEGRVWQEGGSPRRDDQGRWCSPTGRCSEAWAKLGPLKWGVGKLIANADITPVVVPFYHLGMERVMPQDQDNQCVSSMPSLRHNITIKVGDPIHFDDMIQEFMAKAKERAAARSKARGDTSPVEPVAVFEPCPPAHRQHLRASSPDYHLLTDAQKDEEDKLRLKLYSDISQRVFDALIKLEGEVRAHRRKMGYESVTELQS